MSCAGCIVFMGKLWSLIKTNSHGLSLKKVNKITKICNIAESPEQQYKSDQHPNKFKSAGKHSPTKRKTKIIEIEGTF